MMPLGALVSGVVAGALLVYFFTFTQNKLNWDDVLGVLPSHSICGTCGGIAAGIFRSNSLRGLGVVSLASQLLETSVGEIVAIISGYLVYVLIR